MAYERWARRRDEAVASAWIRELLPRDRDDRPAEEPRRPLVEAMTPDRAQPIVAPSPA